MSKTKGKGGRASQVLSVSQNFWLFCDSSHFCRAKFLTAILRGLANLYFSGILKFLIAVQNAVRNLA